jgi:hypothetical protein
LGKGKERLRIGGKESLQAQRMRDYWSPLLPRSILPKGSIGALEVRDDRNCEGSLFALDMAGGL